MYENKYFPDWTTGAIAMGNPMSAYKFIHEYIQKIN